MPRRAVFLIAIIALISLGLLSGRPVNAQTSKDTAALKEIRVLYEQVKREAEWAKTFNARALNVTGIILGIVALLGIAFTVIHTRRIRDYTEEARDFRDRAEGYMKESSKLVGEMESLKKTSEEAFAKQDETIRKHVTQSLQELGEEKARTALFHQFINEGYRNMEGGNYVDALRASEQALEIDDQSPVAWVTKSSALSNLGRYQDALDASTTATNLKPDDAMAWNNKGWLLYRLDHHGNAVEALKIALDLDPNSVLALTNMGLALGDLGSDDEAAKAYDKAIGLEPNNARARYNRARFNCRLGLAQKQMILDDLRIAIEVEAKFKKFAKTESAFEPYRDDPDFRALVFEEGQ